ncbi:MAG: hypothetical protein JSS83_19360 [Cyanobacteria bacterium SZAS LIN-3]|nr:hypothetical protein [Cyanobacteria bacterium SZAS LIN-3]
MSNATGGDFESPTSDANCSGGFCGPIDYDFLFRKDQSKVDERIDTEANFHSLLLQAEENINKGKLGLGLFLYKEAYDIAWDTEALGIDACFGVMFHVHYFTFSEDALRMCADITEQAFQTQDISILRDLWRILPEIGNGSDVHERALILRDDIETRHPEVMTYTEKSGRL